MNIHIEQFRVVSGVNDAEETIRKAMKVRLNNEIDTLRREQSAARKALKLIQENELSQLEHKLNRDLHSLKERQQLEVEEAKSKTRNNPGTCVECGTCVKDIPHIICDRCAQPFCTESDDWTVPVSNSECAANHQIRKKM